MKKISKEELDKLSFDERYNLLSEREQDYFDRMLPMIFLWQS